MSDRQRGTMGGSPERPALFFTDAQEWADWLAANHSTAPDVWMGLHKKHVRERGLTWEDAVVEALRYGWIDSKAQRIDDDAVRQRWTPRRPGSNWSKVNLATVEQLIAEGRMEPAGLAAYQARRADRQGIYSYEQEAGVLPGEYQALLDGSAAASAFWTAATPGYRRICIHWVLGAKQQTTCDRRMAELISSSAAGQLIPSQRYGEIPSWVPRAQAAASAAS